MRALVVLSAFLSLLSTSCSQSDAVADTGRSIADAPAKPAEIAASSAPFSASETSALVTLSGRVGSGLSDARFHAQLPGRTGELHSLQLTSFAVRATTSAASVRSHLDVEIHNTGSTQVEAVMRVPIPPGAAITKSVLYVGDTPMTGAFVQRQRARAIYESIVSRRRDPLLATFAGADWLDIKIFPVEANSRRRFQLEWVEPIAGPAGAETLGYRIPVFAHRGRVVSKPASLTIDGVRYPATSATIEIPHQGEDLVAARMPGDPFGYVALRPTRTPRARANVVLVADTSAGMNLAARQRQRRDLEQLLATFPENARISLIAADWLITSLGRARKTSDIRALLGKLDDLPSAGALDLEQALTAAVDEAVTIGASTIVYAGRGQSRFARSVPAGILDRLRAEEISFHMISGAQVTRSMRELAWLSGGRVLKDGRIALGHLLRPRLTSRALKGKVDRWYPLASVTGELMWLGRFVGAVPAGARRGNGADVRALWVRANLAADRDTDSHRERPYPVLTPNTSLLVLETDADYRRWGLKVPKSGADESFQVARKRGSTRATDARAVDGSAVGDMLGDMRGLESSGERLSRDSWGDKALGAGSNGLGAGGGGTGWGTIGTGRYGTIGHGSGTGSGYGLGRWRQRRSNPPKVRMGRPAVRGSLDKNIIRRVLRRRMARIRYCYEKQLLRSPKLAGRIATKFTIASNGRVTAAQATGMGNAAVERCLVNVLRAMRFPAPRGGGMIMVSYPFHFQPGDGSSTRYVPQPSKWEKALLLLAKKKSLKRIVKDSGAFAGAPQTSSAEVLGWWLVEKHLRGGYVPGDAYVLAARLLRKGGQTRHARRVLSESDGDSLGDAEVLFKRWRADRDAKRFNRLISGH